MAGMGNGPPVDNQGQKEKEMVVKSLRTKRQKGAGTPKFCESGPESPAVPHTCTLKKAAALKMSEERVQPSRTMVEM